MRASYGVRPYCQAFETVRLSRLSGFRALEHVDGPVRADRLAATLPARAWSRLSAGAGSKGDRDYDWAWITLTGPVNAC